MNKEKLSLVLPIYNEGESIPELFGRIRETMEALGYPYEVIAVNDGSRDESRKHLDIIAGVSPEVKVIHFRTNAGQTAAIRAGIEHATGDIIIPLDSDLENDPRDIALLLTKLDEGYDVVSGWRKGRWADKKLVRKLPSILANKLISIISGTHLHDYGCTLKAYRSDVLTGVNLYGEMHRFIPAYAAQTGARVTEVEVTYQPRKYGTSKYGFSRTLRVLLDLLVLKFMHKYKDRPIQFFGLIGAFFAFLGITAGIVAIVLRLGWDLHLVQTPLPVLSALCIIVGVQLVSMGIIAEMVMRTYYESQGKKAYLIQDTLNF
jgi:glycosyltransferase involved in cell wall biosynthesis